MKKIVARIMVFCMLFGLIQTGNTAKTAKAASTDADIYYSTHCQSYGWLKEVKNGEESGTHGQAKRLEAIKIWVRSELSGDVEYEVHCQTYGWNIPTQKNGETCGTTGEQKRLEAIKIRLTGQLAEVYDVVYRVHRQTYGWTDWVKNGEECGTTGEGKRLESIQIKLVRRSGDDTTAIKYTTHCQTHGWLNYVQDGKESGTTGEGKRLEAIKIDVPSSAYTGGIEYSVHCQSYGWMAWESNDMMAGTSGQAKRLEAIKIRLTGELDDQYDVYYRVHSQTYGWLDWAKNGEIAGTSGLAKRLESIQIKLVRKGQAAPGETAYPYVDKTIAEQLQKQKEEEQRRQEEENNKANMEATSAHLREALNSAALRPVVTRDLEVDTTVQKVLAQVTTPTMDNYDKLMACYKWIIDKSFYKYDSYAGSWDNTKVSYKNLQDQTMVSLGKTIIVGRNGQRYGTCVNYAAAMAIFAREIGFDAYYVWGETLNAKNVYSEHSWCIICVNGIWYNFDPQIADNSWAKPVNYFGRTNSEWLSLGYKFSYYDTSRKKIRYVEEYMNTNDFK